MMFASASVNAEGVASITLAQTNTPPPVNPGAATPTAAGGAGTPVMKERTLVDYVRAGGPIGAILVGLSVTAVALAITHLLQARLSKLAPADISDELSRRLREGDFTAAQRLCADAGNDSVLTRVFGSGFARCLRSPLGFMEMKPAMEEAGAREGDKLLKPIEFLGLIAALGPMLGLLGTVIGMIGAFMSIGELEGAARSRKLAEFMSLALVTTAMGLIVAIPCTIMYSMFKRRLERVLSEVQEIAEGLSTLLENRPVTGAGASPARAAVARGPSVGGPSAGGGNPTVPLGGAAPRAEPVPRAS